MFPLQFSVPCCWLIALTPPILLSINKRQLRKTWFQTIQSFLAESESVSHFSLYPYEKRESRNALVTGWSFGFQQWHELDGMTERLVLLDLTKSWNNSHPLHRSHYIIIRAASDLCWQQSWTALTYRKVWFWKQQPILLSYRCVMRILLMKFPYIRSLGWRSP